MSTETYQEKHEYGSLEGRFATIASAVTGGYDWDAFHVMRGADGHLYVGSSSGCSCSSFSDEDGDDFTRVLSWQEAADNIKTWFTDDANDWNRDERTSEGMSLIERLNQLRPVAFLGIDPRNPWGGAS